jgi:predicted extracellular nuclease
MIQSTNLLLLLSILCWSCRSQQPTTAQSASSSRIAFYNVENLFDTVDDPNHADDDFTPDGKQKWTTERYEKKLNQVAQVIEDMEFPDFLGLCEIENSKVLADLIRTDKLKTKKYEIAHFDSPDYRGIDVALLYDKEQFKLKSAKPIVIDIPDDIEANYTTRDILQVYGLYQELYPLYIFVNHWPSRRGGLAKSEPKRLFAATQLRRAVDAILSEDATASIIIMGDMNDETDNKSITEVLNVSKLNESPQPQRLYNCFSDIDAQQLGSYNYRGNWNMLDQIIVSSSLADAEGWQVTKPTVFQQDWMTFEHDRFGNVPNRTYGGPNYYGGISDHFPVYVDLVYTPK